MKQVNREALTAEDVCMHCGRDLRTVDEIHVVEGMHFCTCDCAIFYETNQIIANAKDQATQWYNNFSEIVKPVDIGIAYEETWEAYSDEADVTTIFLSRYKDAERTQLMSTRVIGFYHGEPNDKDTEAFVGSLEANYMEDVK